MLKNAHINSDVDWSSIVEAMVYSSIAEAIGKLGDKEVVPGLSRDAW